VSAANTIALVINALTIALALFMLIIILWQDSRSEANLFFGVLMIMLVAWAAGILLGRVTAGIGGLGSLTEWGVRLLEIGFTGSCIGLYLFTVILSGGQGRWFLRLAVVSIVLVLAYQGLLAFSERTINFEIRPDGTLRYAFGPLPTLIYGTFSVATIAVAWQRRRKIGDNGLLFGICGFSLGMLLDLISPEMRNKSIGSDLSAVSALILSYSMVRVQIIEPLAGRANQLRAVRDVGLAITSQLRLEEVLSTIAGQAAEVLAANGAAIFLNQGGTLELAAVHNMPDYFLGQRLAIGEGLAGQVAATRQSTRIEDYRRDWKGQPDMPFAKESFGAVAAAPLIFADEVMGVLVVIEGPQGRRFSREDLRLLDLLGPQAAVAITNSRLFGRQQALTSELEAAKNQLESVLTSTENPVLALNRRFEVIFANPAATSLMGQSSVTGRSIRDIVPINTLPSNPAKALRDLHRRRFFIYELEARGRTYLCHTGLMGSPHPQGYVAVLNDVSQLKELDRLKNQMIHMTSHDLKNPLSAAMFHVELLQEEGEGIFTEEMRDDIGTIWAQLQRMNRIIRGILDLERVQAGTLNYEECSIEQLTETSIREFASQAAKKGVTLRSAIMPDLPPVVGDRHQLLQAIGNLIENAVKFTLDGGTVTVSAEQAEDHVLIHVTDTGVGISSEAQPHVFERFYRAYHPGMEQVSGTGLGLSLVKAVIDAHKGRIWLESEVGKGTTIHLILPARQDARNAVHKTSVEL